MKTLFHLSLFCDIRAICGCFTAAYSRAASSTVIAIASCWLATCTFGLPGDATANPLNSSQVILDTSFEQGQTMPKMEEHQVVTDKASSGSQALMGNVTEPRQARYLRIPFQANAGMELRASFQLCGDKGTAATLWIRTSAERTKLSSADLVPKWQEVRGAHVFTNDTEGTVEIIAPSSYTGKPGRAWIDDVLVTVSQPGALQYRTELQSFPAVAFDQAGTAWLSTMGRLTPLPFISVYRLEKNDPVKVCTLAARDLTGVASPAIAGLAKGCVVAFPVEQKDRWAIAYAFVTAKTTRQPRFKLIPCRGNANINPALAISDNRVWAVWESNADGYRAIYGCWIEPTGCGKPQRLSAPGANSYNPTIVTLEDGSVFAAWDSLRGLSAEIYGTACRDGQWQPERRLTSQARIARHPALAAWNNQVWMAFQAQSYSDKKNNSLNEQRIIVAQLDSDQLLAPRGFFENVSLPDMKLMRPRLAFDTSGRLWLTARKSISENEGWSPLLWCYSGGTWSQAEALLDNPGRWQPVPMAFSSAGAVAAVQFDDVPGKRGYEGKDFVRHFGVQVVPLPFTNAPAAQPLKTEPLKVPGTEFSLAKAKDLVAASFPRQQINHGGRTLKAFFGNFHDHTDLSICARAVNPPGHDLFANIRDIDQIDFAATTDHDYDFDQALWDYNGEQTRNNHDPGRFVTFLGHEWTSIKNPGLKPGDPNRYGHRNFIFLDPHFNRFCNSFAGDISPAEVWKQLKDVSFFCVPHQLCDWKDKGKGNPPTDWTFVDEVHQPVAEIFQTRGSYEHLGSPRQSPNATPFKGYFIQDAWAKGIVIGVIASPDHGGGYGKVGVWAENLSREAIFEAVRARHTFGTSGAKMSLFFNVGDIFMGDKAPRPNGSLTFRVQAKALRDIKELVIFRNNETVFRQVPGRKEIEVSWTDADPPATKHLWYYSRIQTTDEEIAWSSPIWFTDK